MHRLEEVCQKITDGSHFSPKTADKGFPYVTVRDIDNDLIDFANCKFIAAADYHQLLKNGCRPHKGDVLFSKDGTVGKVALIDYEKEFVVLSSLAIVRPDPSRIDSAFLKWVLKSPAFLDEAVGKKTGAAIRRIILRNLKSIHIPVPPLPEQQRIVALLDEAFAGLATAKANAEKNLQNAHALFESHLQSVFTQHGPGWNEKKLGDVCELFQGLCINAKTKHLLVEKSSLPLLRIKDLRSNSAEQFIAETDWPKNAKVSGDEIIYTRTGQIGLVFRGRVGVLHNNCFKVRPKPGLNNDYLFWWLQNPEFRMRITSLASKAAQPDITHALFKAQPIQIPPRDYQDKMIAVIDEIREETQRLTSIYEQKIVAIDALKQSLLHQAFNGQL